MTSRPNSPASGGANFAANSDAVRFTSLSSDPTTAWIFDSDSAVFAFVFGTGDGNSSRPPYLAKKFWNLSPHSREIFPRASRHSRISQRKYAGAQNRTADAGRAHPAAQESSAYPWRQENGPGARIHCRKFPRDRTAAASSRPAQRAESNPASRLPASAVWHRNHGRADNWPARLWKHTARIPHPANRGSHP